MNHKSCTVKEVVASIREGRFTSLGSYPKFYVTADCAVLSHEAVKENLLLIGRAMNKPGSDKQWEVVGIDVNWESEDMYCEHTGEKIPSAYYLPKGL